MMRYATVFSGIEAPTVAWECLGWEPQWFAEIEPFPSAVLAHHYPHVANLGDMTKLKETLTDEQKNIQILCGGSPCQSFSIAGLREGLADPRGNLTLEYVRLVDACRPEWVIWENVPGVLSSNGGRDFKAFLDAMGHIGYYGAYRVLDAQYFGVPQRRRRVFAIFCPGDWTRAVKVLFERESVCWDTPPSREKGARVAPSLSQSLGSSGGIGMSDQELFSQGGGGLAFGDELQETTGPITAGIHKGPRGSEAVDSDWLIAFTQNDAARDAAENVTPTLRSGNSGGTVHPAIAFMPGQGAKAGSVAAAEELAPTLKSTDSGTNRTPAVAYSMMPMNSGKDFKARETDIAQPVCAAGPSLGNQGGDVIIHAIHLHQIGRKDEAGPQGKGWLEDGAAYTHDNRGVAQAVAIQTGRPNQHGLGVSEENCYTLSAAKDIAVQQHSVVRRLTEVECERLQGFPDNYTLIPWKGKPTEDCPMGPRYKALGNSMAVPVMRWIGNRIHLLEAGLGDLL